MSHLYSKQYELANRINLEYFCTDVKMAFVSPSIDKIKNLLHNTDFTVINKNKVEEYIFLESVNMIQNSARKQILNYLVFDYRINENNSLHLMTNKIEEIDKLFNLRKLAENLNQNLESSKDKVKRIKI